MDTVLFDLDETLIVEWKSAEESFIETISGINYPVNPDEFVKAIKEKARELWHKLSTIDFCREIGISSWEALWADFTGDNEKFKKLRDLSEGFRLETWSQTLYQFKIYEPGIANTLSLEFKRIRNTKHRLFPETNATLDKLKSLFKLGLITNGAPDLQWKKITGGNLRQYFDCIVISGEHGYAKPDKRLFDAAMAGLKSKKSGTYMVGDNIIADIKGAQDSGLKTIWVNRNQNDAKGIKPDYEISDLTEILNILRV
jgi:putative hydrolase of the HAD superfamily